MKYKIVSFDQDLGTVTVEYINKDESLVTTFGMPLATMTEEEIHDFITIHYPMDEFIRRNTVRNADPVALQAKLDAMAAKEYSVTEDKINALKNLSQSSAPQVPIIDISAINVVKV